jgi:[protein-PII] uridylyltransferase
VVLDNSASEMMTVIEVYARDRIGLLYTISRTLDDLLLDVKLAKVSTLGEQVVDVFYVADSRGDKVTDADHLAEIERAVLFALREEALGGLGRSMGT